MQRAILAVSPNLQFLEQIRSHLEEGGRYRVQGVTSSSDALALVKNTYFDLAILDAESSDVPFVPFTRDLVAAQPGLKMLVFPPSNNPHHPVLAGLVANGFLKKPFFTPEVSRAFKELFSEKPEEPVVESQPITNLAELWMKRPEVSFNRVEQLLGSTTAQTGLLIARGRVIAASGAVDDEAIQQVLKILETSQPERATQDLIRFLTIKEDEEILIYASQLIPEVTLVLFYSSSTSIQLARQEVFQVKNEFKEVYPNTSELRKELAFTSDARRKGSEISEGGKSNLKPLEEEIGFEDLDTVLSSAELKSLDAMLSEMPSPDPGSDENVEQLEPEPIKDLDLTDWLPLPEDFEAVEKGITETEAEQEMPTGSEVGESQPEPPALPDELLEKIQSPSSDEAEMLDAFPIETPEETLPVEPTNEVVAAEPPGNEPDSEAFDFDKIWDNQEESKLPIAETAHEETDEGFISDIVGNEEPGEIPVPFETPLPAEPEIEKVDDDALGAWLDDLKAEQPGEPEAIPAHDSQENVFPPPLPGFEPVWLEQATGIPPAMEETAVEIPLVENVDANGLMPPTVKSELEEITAQPLPEPGEAAEPSVLSESSAISDIFSEPGTVHVAVNQFRFRYSCMLIPRDPGQFLTGDVNERLSFILPQLHLEYGWHLTGISIRPQYMIWSVSVPMSTCPIDIIQEIRRRTSTHLFSNFPELRTEENQTDFWAPGFLALSGSSGPSAGMIYDFIKSIRNNQKPGD